MKVAVIGCGVMGRAFAAHFSKKHPVILFDHQKEKSDSLAKEIEAKSSDSIQKAVQEADVVVLAVKPKDLSAVSQAASSAFSEKQIFVSILAGTSVEDLKKHFPKPHIVRAMPNLALICEKGVIGLVDTPSLEHEVKHKIDALLKGMGLVYWLPESKIDALTALAGSGPAFILVMIEAMMEGGVYMGFTSQEARELVLETMEGTVALLRAGKQHPAEIRAQIASPGGTTIAGLREMESSGVRAGIINTLLAAFKRSKEM